MNEDEVVRILAAAETLSTEAHHRLATAEGSTVPCLFPGCVLSAAEHHRLAYGLLAENRELKRRVEALEHGPLASPSPVPDDRTPKEKP